MIESSDMAEVKQVRAVCVCVAVVILSFVGCTADKNRITSAQKAAEAQQLEDLIKQGFDPIAARCAVKGTDTPACTIYAAQSNNKDRLTLNYTNLAR